MNMLKTLSMVILLFSFSFLSVSAQTGQPVKHSDGTLRRIRLPILMYHYVSPIPIGSDTYRRELTVEPELFALHMQYLHDDGYSTVSLLDLHNALLFGIELPKKPIILTFDDGYIDHYEFAFPILKNYGLQATFFIITGHIDEGYPEHLNWEQIVEMDAAGMEIGSHSKHHQDLRNKGFDYLVYELLGSYQTLMSELGDPPLSFSYPSGFYDVAAVRVVQSIPYRIAVTTEPGDRHTLDDIFTVRRIRIYGNMPVENLAAFLNSR